MKSMKYGYRTPLSIFGSELLCRVQPYSVIADIMYGCSLKGVFRGRPKVSTRGEAKKPVEKRAASLLSLNRRGRKIKDFSAVQNG